MLNMLRGLASFLFSRRSPALEPVLIAGTSTQSVPARIRRGVAFFDAYVPDWYKRVNPSTLDIQNVEKCILGQLYGCYWRGLEQLNISYDDSENYGLSGDDGKACTLAYRDIIRDRQHREHKRKCSERAIARRARRRYEAEGANN